MKLLNTPAEMLNIMSELGRKKAHLHPSKTRALAMMAGIFIALGAAASTTIYAVMDHSPMAPFLGALVFSIGIVSTLLAGAELFTGNILVIVAFLDRKVSIGSMLLNWSRVFLWNLLGALFFMSLTYYTANDTTFSQILVETAEKKVNLQFMEAILLGFLCNLVVCLSVWTALAANDALGKFVLSAFAVLIFVLLKYEHVVANMFYIPYGYLSGANFSIGKALLSSFVPVTIGNILGGLFLGTIYHLAYREKPQFNK
ncbi:MAG: formate/nitrite transporter family protein [Tissierellia bacterium]|nr:formate/nitrite transporter family protein [Tissierellia bacterium]